MNISNIRVLLLVAFAFALSACGSADPKAENTPTELAVAADNTAKNERDNSGATATPVDQGENKADLDITATIRQAIVDDKSLSANAHNIKVITNTGIVTLRGPVKSDQEKMAIEAKAKQVAGVARVDNQLEIEPPK